MQLVGAFVAGGATNQHSQLTLIPQEAQGDLAWSMEPQVGPSDLSLLQNGWAGRREGVTKRAEMGVVVGRTITQ